MKIYQHPIIQTIEVFYGELLYRLDRFPGVYQHLYALAGKLWEGIQQGNTDLFTEINNYHPQYLGKSAAEIRRLGLSLEDCRTTIANEYGFADWLEVERQKATRYDVIFEKAVNHLLNGKLERLKASVHQYPDLIKRRSVYGHRATILHYVASNGVELWRQKVPFNLPAITRFLLEAGADPEAKMNVYGGAFTTKALLSTSAHPLEAGLREEMMKIFN